MGSPSIAPPPCTSVNIDSEPLALSISGPEKGWHACGNAKGYHLYPLADRTLPGIAHSPASVSYGRQGHKPTPAILMRARVSLARRKMHQFVSRLGFRIGTALTLGHQKNFAVFLQFFLDNGQMLI